MNSSEPSRTELPTLWKDALRASEVWRRSLRISLVVGTIQVLINQGDAWFDGGVTAGVVIKTIATPLVTFSVALYAAASTYVDRRRQEC